MNTALRTAFFSAGLKADVIKTFELFINVDVYFILSTAPLHRSHPIQTPSSQHSYSDTNPRLSSCSLNACSCSECDSDPDQVSTHSEQPPRKERHRTTFSPIEVWELERVYRRQPYLMSQDEKDLVQRLGITAKSLKVNRDLLLLENGLRKNLTTRTNNLWIKNISF